MRLQVKKRTIIYLAAAILLLLICLLQIIKVYVVMNWAIHWDGWVILSLEQMLWEQNQYLIRF